MNDFLAKPIAFDALQVSLQRWLKAGDVVAQGNEESRPVDPTQIQALLAKLIPLLAENKYDALNQYKALQQAVARTTLEEKIRQAGEPLQEFKFSTTLTHLREIAHEQGWEIPD